MNKPQILAVHKRKLKQFLEKLELLEPLQKGELKCAICGITISFDNIGLIIPSGDKILVCCSGAECMFKAKELRGASDEG
jgi:hypothetical protein